MDANAQIDLHEGEWIYFSALFTQVNGTAEALRDGIAEAIRSRGWVVLDRHVGAQQDAQRESRRLEALRTADACVFDVSSPSEIVGAEIATAVCSGRPVIALEHESHPAPAFISALLNRSRLRTVIRYRSVDDCVQALNSTLEDRKWRRAAGLAAVDAV